MLHLLLGCPRIMYINTIFASELGQKRKGVKQLWKLEEEEKKKSEQEAPVESISSTF